MASLPHISVCICTYKRPDLLQRTLEGLENQQTNGLFTYSAVVADNDAEGSAREAVEKCNARGRMQAVYCMEPQKNIAMARNRAVQTAGGDFIAFIDDDEFPIGGWLVHLFEALQRYGVAGVLGPVKPHFDAEPPRWVREGKFFDRPEYRTGYRMTWNQTRTGNVLFSKAILKGDPEPFRVQFATAGEDMDFFRRMMEQGEVFLWCNEAIVYEVVPPARCTRKYLLRRALLRGSNFSKHPTERFTNAVTSLIAVPCYTVALPVLALFGQHVFLRYLIKLLDHSSRLLSYLGWSLVTQRQT